MLAALTDQQQQWVNNAFASMSIEEKIGHLMCPSWDGQEAQEWLDILKEVPLGCMFFADWRADLIREGVDVLQEASRIPMLIAADMEPGLAVGTKFPEAMACTASGHADLMAQRGRATAREARELGVSWSFAPNIDIPFNHRNLETLTRAWSDDPDTIIKMVQPLIGGMQKDGLLAATGKHFPGTGLDDRDQHMCTVLNSLPMDEWRASYGKVWKAVIDVGVMAVMPGHIALPAYEGLDDNPTAAMPATLNPKLMIDLLRKELGFEGVIVSDAGVMVGFASRVAKDEMATKYVESGGDVFLFPNVKEDFGYLMQAHKDGRLPLERIDASVKRILAMKARLNVPEFAKCEPVTEAEKTEFTEISRTFATDAVTILRDGPGLPTNLKPGAKVLTVLLAPDGGRESHRTKEMKYVDEELRKRGFEVTSLKMPGHDVLLKAVEEYDHVFLNIQVCMHQMMGNSRIIDSSAMNFWCGWWYDHDNVTFTSFGSPYHLYEFPHFPNMVLTYSACEHAQRAAVKVWLGEMEAKGKCPVKMPKQAGPTNAERSDQ